MLGTCEMGSHIVRQGASSGWRELRVDRALRHEKMHVHLCVRVCGYARAYVCMFQRLSYLRNLQ